MLVKDPNQRYTVEQIKKHKWMQADPAVKTILADNDEVNFEGEKILDEYNEQALELMQGLGIDIERTKKVSRKLKTSGVISSLLTLTFLLPPCHNSSEENNFGISLNDIFTLNFLNDFSIWVTAPIISVKQILLVSNSKNV